MRIRGSLLYFGAVAALLTAGLSARADFIQVTASFDSSQPLMAATTYATYTLPSGGPTTEDVYAGIYHFTIQTPGIVSVSSGDPYVSPIDLTTAQHDLNFASGGFNAVCIDFTHNISSSMGSLTWDVASMGDMGSALLNGVGINAKQAGAIEFLFDKHWTAAKANPTSAADFQMAIWDVIYDGQLDGNTSSMSFASQAQSTQSTNWVNAAEVANSDPNNLYSSNDVYALISTSGSGGSNTQDFSFAYVPGSDPVPLPASVGVGFSMLAGFGALFGIRKRLSRRPRIA